jgi:peptide/nickel transport system ATP-binding protein
MVINKGTIVERGAVTTVMHEPSHPYTRLLLDSIPQPDPDQRWTNRIEVDDSGDQTPAAEVTSTPPGSTAIL